MGIGRHLVCPDIDSVYVHFAGLRTEMCPYHQIIHINNKGERVTSDCCDIYEMKHSPWFVLPPVQEWYYRQKHPNYEVLPPLSADCNQNAKRNSMDIIYPRELTKIYIPIDLDGKTGQVIFQVAHRVSEKTIFWHIDNEYVGSTKDIHEMGITIKEGKHTLTLVDENGETFIRKFVDIREKIAVWETNEIQIQLFLKYHLDYCLKLLYQQHLTCLFQYL
ncbi:MAG: hypothetical protein MZV63_41990 [Marinilabiliales bacterium]|nr:hypothetical protein [Marinilabiliales bacterium]